MSKIEKLVEDLSALTVLEAADLAKLLEEKWGVSAAAPVAAAAARDQEGAIQRGVGVVNHGCGSAELCAPLSADVSGERRLTL